VIHKVSSASAIPNTSELNRGLLENNVFACWDATTDELPYRKSCMHGLLT